MDKIPYFVLELRSFRIVREFQVREGIMKLQVITSFFFSLQELSLILSRHSMHMSSKQGKEDKMMQKGGPHDLLRIPVVLSLFHVRM